LALFGMGGVGKTQIAIEYVSQFETQYEGVYWITAESSAQLLSGLVSIAKATRCTEVKSREQAEVAVEVFNWLYRNEDWLLVVDNQLPTDISPFENRWGTRFDHHTKSKQCQYYRRRSPD
jgi:NB-ARC domain